MDATIHTRLEEADKITFEALAGKNIRKPAEFLRMLILKANKEQTIL